MSVLSNETGKRHGQYVAINGSASMWLRMNTIGQKANQHLFLADANSQDFKDIANLIDENEAITPVIFKEFEFNAENVAEGFELLKGRRVVGKIVFNMISDDIEEEKE